jgi:hypothetical protein
VEHALRDWKCKKCGRSNKTVVALDGTATCSYCAEKMSIQPNRDYLHQFSTLHPEVVVRSEGRWL